MIDSSAIRGVVGMGTLEGSQADVLLEGSQAVVPLFSGLVRDLWSVKRKGSAALIYSRGGGSHAYWCTARYRRHTVVRHVAPWRHAACTRHHASIA